MRTIARILLGVLSLFFVLNAEAQIGLENFIPAIEKRAVTLKKSQNSNIKKFMKYGYKHKPFLKNDSITKVPIYSIFTKRKLIHLNATPDSLFEYLNPQSLALDEVYFYRGDSCINIGFAKYWKLKKQDVGVCRGNISEISKYIHNENPKLVFKWSGEDVYFMLNNDSSLTCFLLDYKRRRYIKYTPEQMINILMQYCSSDSTKFWWMSKDFEWEPPVYSR